MKTVDICQLENNLDRYLKHVQEGETVYVTDRSVVIAEIHKPIPAVAGQVCRWDSFLDEEERRGSVRRAMPGRGLSLAGLRAVPRYTLESGKNPTLRVFTAFKEFSCS